MITPQQAVEAAVKYFLDVSKAVLTIDPGIALDEIDKTDDGKYWEVILSHRDTSATSLVAVYQGGETRVRKIFKINATSGEVESMKKVK